MLKAEKSWHLLLGIISKIIYYPDMGDWTEGQAAGSSPQFVVLGCVHLGCVHLAVSPITNIRLKVIKYLINAMCFVAGQHNMLEQ